MAFIETFTAIFMATLMSQICIWLIDRYIKTHLTKIADNVEGKIKNGGNKK
jgi:hypothetical protein